MLSFLSEDLASPILSIILTVVILLLALVVLYHLIQKIASFIGKSKKEREAREILELKKRERSLLNKLEDDKRDITKKIGNLQGKSVAEKKIVKRKSRRKKKK